MERWSGKTAVVTGASAGIGSAVAVTLANAGLHVLGLARRPHLVDELRTKVNGRGSLHSRKCDVSKLDDLADTFNWVEEHMGGVHVLINNAGVSIDKYITEFGDPVMSDAEVSSLIDTNFRATVMSTRYAISSMKKWGCDGHIVNINSIVGHYVPQYPKLNVYPSTKYAVTAFTEALLNELGHTKCNTVKVTSLSPGLVDTSINFKSTETAQNLPALQPQDVADAVLYVLTTPPNVNIPELTVEPVGETRF